MPSVVLHRPVEPTPFLGTWLVESLGLALVAILYFKGSGSLRYASHRGLYLYGPKELGTGLGWRTGKEKGGPFKPPLWFAACYGTVPFCLVSVLVPSLAPFFTRVSEDGYAARVYKTKGGAGRSVGRRRGCTHNGEHMTILSKRRQVAPAAARLKAVG